MQFKYLVFASLVASSSSLLAATYDPDDLKKFEETNACSKCNLAHVTLTRNHQKANLEGANLSSSSLYGDYTKANLAGINGSGTKFDSVFSEVNFNNAILIDANFFGANLTNADFTGANLQGASLAYANLIDAKISPDQLASAKSICNATLPDGSKGKCKE